MTGVCVRPGCDEPLLPWLYVRFCSTRCREGDEPTVAAPRPSGSVGAEAAAKPARVWAERDALAANHPPSRLEPGSAGATVPKVPKVPPGTCAASGPRHPAGCPEGHFRPDPQMGQQRPECTPVGPVGRWLGRVFKAREEQQ